MVEKDSKRRFGGVEGFSLFNERFDNCRDDLEENGVCHES